MTTLVTHDTEIALVTAAALVNTWLDGVEHLDSTEALFDFLDGMDVPGPRTGSPGELRAVRALRPRLRAVWESPSRAEAAGLVNVLLTETGARPQLSGHDDWDWHLHFTDPRASLAHRMGSDAAAALADLVRADDLVRLRRCAAPDCDAVLVDLSRNRSRRYCDTGNCGNRIHVAAYRARRAG
jgi:predicted RNA-binding Zn ribbon-like protein